MQDELEPEVIAALMFAEEQGVSLASSAEDFCRFLLKDVVEEDLIRIRQKCQRLFTVLI